MNTEEFTGHKRDGDVLIVCLQCILILGTIYESTYVTLDFFRVISSTWLGKWIYQSTT